MEFSGVTCTSTWHVYYQHRGIECVSIPFILTYDTTWPIGIQYSRHSVKEITTVSLTELLNKDEVYQLIGNRNTSFISMATPVTVSPWGSTTCLLFLPQLAGQLHMIPSHENSRGSDKWSHQTCVFTDLTLYMPEAANFSGKIDCFGRVVLGCFAFLLCCCVAFSISWSEFSCNIYEELRATYALEMVCHRIKNGKLSYNIWPLLRLLFAQFMHHGVMWWKGSELSVTSSHCFET